jgi:hypothetical protein
MTKFLAIGFGAMTFAALTACSEDTLPKYSYLSGLRILAVQAANSGDATIAEAVPGDTFTITPYVSDYKGTGTLTYTATACIDPGVNRGADPSCTGVPGATSVGSGAVTITGANRTGTATSFTVTIPSADVVFAGRGAVDQYNGVNYLVSYVLTSSSGASIASYKRIPVSTKTSKNHNPSVSAITAQGATLTSLPSGAVELAATTSIAESYSAQKSDGSLTSLNEDLEFTWFVTDGALKYFRTVQGQTTTFTPPSSAPTDHSAMVVVIVRDGRGGLGFRQQSL